MRRMILAVAVIVFFGTPSTYADTKKVGNWSVNTTIDSFDDSKSMFGILEIPPSFGFVLSCTKGEALAVRVVSLKGKLKGDFTTPVGIRIGRNKPFTEDWVRFNNATNAVHQHGSDLVTKILASKSNQLIIRLELEHKIETLNADITGIEKVWTEVTRECGWK